VNVLQKAPNVIVVCVTVIVVSVIVGTTVLIATNHDPSQLQKILPTILSGLATLTGAGAWLYAGASAKSGDNVEKQMNGTLNTKIAQAISVAMYEHANASHQPVTIVTPVVTQPPSSVDTAQ
jgi:hypothetical protein